MANPFYTKQKGLPEGMMRLKSQKDRPQIQFSTPFKREEDRVVFPKIKVSERPL